MSFSSSQVVDLCHGNLNVWVCLCDEHIFDRTCMHFWLRHKNILYRVLQVQHRHVDWVQSFLLPLYCFGLHKYVSCSVSSK